MVSTIGFPFSWSTSHRICSPWHQALSPSPSLLPRFSPLIGLLCFIYYILQRIFRRTSRELKRIDSILRSPLQANISETLSGLCTLRAYQAERRFVALNRQLTDATNRADYLLTMTQRWLGATTETINAVLALVVALGTIVGRETISPSLAGLALVYISGLLGRMNWCIREST